MAPDKEAVIANWVRGDEMWQVDVTARSITLVSGECPRRGHGAWGRAAPWADAGELVIQMAVPVNRAGM